MNTFNPLDDFPTCDLVHELLERIEQTNGLDFTSFETILQLRHVLSDYISENVFEGDRNQRYKQAVTNYDFELRDVNLPTLSNPRAL
jgi:hypothetical protein